MQRLLPPVVAALAAIFLLSTSAAPSLAQGKKLTLVVPGIPPIFASLIAYVAEKQGLFAKYGAPVEVKPSESGTAGARALISRDVDISLSPSPLIVSQISNAGVDLVGIYGLPNPSYVLASTDPKAGCKDVAGQAVGVDTVGGARSNALKEILATCGGRIEDVQQVTLPSSATQQAMIADRIKFGVLHFDELPVIEAQGKPVKVVLTLNEVNPNSHFAMFTVRRADLAAQRDNYVRALAGLIAAARFMAGPENADRFADIAAGFGRSKEEAKGALRRFVEVDYWPSSHDGLPPAKLEAVIATAVKTGGILAGKQPVTYDRLVDRSVWKDAQALVAATN
jgi:ABC-type nitrate/sulfonate/bicarbonate transport system substrate-binding protein